MAYQLTKDDGTVISGVTVKDGIVYGPDGKRFGPTSMFPDLQNEKGQRVTIQTARATDDDGNYMDDDPAIIRDDDGETRTSPVTGIVQTGKKLGLGDINGLFASLNERGQMTKGDLPSAGKFFSEALVTTPQASYQGGELSIETEKDTGYELPITVKTGGSQGQTLSEDDTSIKGGSGYQISPKSVPGTVGGNPSKPEDGTSDKPDVADQVRQVRMHRNKRDGLEGFSSDEPFGGVDTTKGNGMTASRRAARSAFLDEGNKGYAAIRARDRAVGAFHQYDQGGMRIGDDIHMFKEGMSKDARFELSGNGIKSKEDAQTFLNKYVQGFNETAPTDSPTEPPASEQTDTTLAWKDMNMDQKKAAFSSLGKAVSEINFKKPGEEN